MPPARYHGESARTLESVNLADSQPISQAGRQAGREAVRQAGMQAETPSLVFFGGSLHLQAMVNLICAGKDSGRVDKQLADGQLSGGSNPVLDS